MRFSDLIELKPACKGMGTTIVFLYFGENETIIAWVGDSRGYHIRDGNVLFQTEDHNYVNELVRQGELTRKQASIDNRRNILTRSILGSYLPTEIDFNIIKDIKPYDFFFLCSDGMLEHIDDTFIQHNFISLNNPTVIKEKIIEACHNKTSDNYSMYLIQVEG